MATFALTSIDGHFIPGASATINCPGSKHWNREACQDVEISEKIMQTSRYSTMLIRLSQMHRTTIENNDYHREGLN